ncbi:AP-4 complex subunit mu-like, partial [Cyclospora cayetanensis]|uniref:AP-4 complex subunit mu-like n=1 Tax=Cyclospora cayetanensis TaxID=88456 RepID=A0A6P6RZX3_9EIME
AAAAAAAAAWLAAAATAGAGLASATAAATATAWLAVAAAAGLAAAACGLTAATWFAAVAAGSEAPPVFTVGGLSFAFLRRSGLLFVLVTQQNPSPSLLIEVLLRIVKAIKDFCGVLSEEVVRRNFVLIYELLDEVCDCGYPQQSATESLKSAIHSEAVLIEPQPPKTPAPTPGL